MRAWPIHHTRGMNAVDLFGLRSSRSAVVGCIGLAKTKVHWAGMLKVLRRVFCFYIYITNFRRISFCFLLLLLLLLAFFIPTSKGVVDPQDPHNPSKIKFSKPRTPNSKILHI